MRLEAPTTAGAVLGNRPAVNMEVLRVRVGFDECERIKVLHFVYSDN